MNKVLVRFVSVYPGPAGKLHRAEASRLMEEVNMKTEVNDLNVP